jgi:thiamine transport system substrate-binding protein
MKKLLIIILSLVFITAASCTPAPQVLNVMTHDSFAVSESVIEVFESENNVKVNFLLSGDAGSMLNQAVLTKGNPVADVLYGVDNTFLSRALEEGIFEAFESPQLAHIPAEFKLDGTFSALPVDYGDVCINYDRGYFKAKNLDLPKSLEDLANPVYEGMLVVENPATSSPGLAFLMATIVEYGEEGYLDYWQRLLDNGAVVVNDWETAYYSNFSGSSGKGPQPMVVSYGTSPAAEVFFAETDLDEAPTSSLVGRNMCYRQIEFVGILAGAKNRKMAEAFVDFMLNTIFQEDIPLNMFVFPVNENAVLPDVFVDHIQTVEKPASLPMVDIAANREQWIEAWREIILE